MGCGKSSLGKPLAKLLDAKFIDLDTYIEERTAMSIKNIFSSGGERSFRLTERECLVELLDMEGDYVIATGGGTPCYEDNIDLMNSGGLTLFINLPAGMLVSRLSSSRKSRPLIDGLSDSELSSFVENALEQRMPYYKKAKITIEGKGIVARDAYNVLINYQDYGLL